MCSTSTLEALKRGECKWTRMKRVLVNLLRRIFKNAVARIHVPARWTRDEICTREIRDAFCFITRYIKTIIYGCSTTRLATRNIQKV